MVGGQLSLSGAGSVFRALKALDTPRLYLSYGPSIGAAAYMAGLCDVVLAVEGASAFASPVRKSWPALFSKRRRLRPWAGRKLWLKGAAFLFCRIRKKAWRKTVGRSWLF